MRFNVRPGKIVSAIMLIAVVNVYVLANGALSSKTMQGRLVTTSNRPVLVNGGEAITGTVILSGAQVTTVPPSDPVSRKNWPDFAAAREKWLPLLNNPELLQANAADSSTNTTH